MDWTTEPQLDSMTPFDDNVTRSSVMLGQGDLADVLTRLATAVNNDHNWGAVGSRVRAQMLSAYKALAYCELDGDGFLRKRLDLVRAFAYPELDVDGHYPLAGEINQVYVSGAFGADGKHVDVPPLKVVLLIELMRGLADALPTDLKHRDILKFVGCKTRIDEWCDELVRTMSKLRQIPNESVSVFESMAARVRADDPMTDPLFQFGEQLEKIRTAALEAGEARDAAREAAGQTADATLSTHFSSDADADGTTAAALSIGSLVSLVVAFGVGVAVIGDLENVGIATELAKLALTLPLLAISAYLGRLSTHYRESARWAKTAAVQLKTIDAFTQGVVEDVNRDEMKLMLGKRIFSDPGFGNDGKNPDVADLVALVEAIGNAVKTKE